MQRGYRVLKKLVGENPSKNGRKFLTYSFVDDTTLAEAISFKKSVIPKRQTDGQTDRQADKHDSSYSLLSVKNAKVNGISFKTMAQVYVVHRHIIMQI